MKNATTMTNEGAREVAALRSAVVSGSTVPLRVLLAPWGQVESENGSFVVDEEGARLAVEAFAEHGTDLPIDYEHQTLGGAYAAPNGRAPAAGWVKGLTFEPGVGLLARIEWTDQAKEMLVSKEYRYLSPVAIIRKTDRKLVAIHSAALTNKPAIKDMQPIVHRSDPPDVDDDTLALLRCELNLEEEAGAREVLVAAGRRLVDLQRAIKQREVDRRVCEAMRCGKLVEAQRTWAEALVAREEGLFDEWLRTAPVIVNTGRISPPVGESETPSRARAAAARARSEFRSDRLLQSLTTEEAYLADAVREAKRRAG